MKVFFDHRIFLLQKYGGISKYISKLNQYLAYKNVNSIIVSPISINSYLEKKKENEIVHLRFKKVYKYCNKIFNFYNVFYLQHIIKISFQKYKLIYFDLLG